MDAPSQIFAETVREDAEGRIAVDQGAEPSDWQDIFNRLNRRARRLPRHLLAEAAFVATMAGVLGVAGVLAMAVTAVYPDLSTYFLALFVIPPGLLAGAATGQAGGNLFLRLWFGLDNASRRGFASRLTLARAPENWPIALKRWLFTGDWLGSPAYDLRLPYLRIFVMGAAPATCGEEDALWSEIHQAIAGEGDLEAGSNHREIAYPRQLPSWVRDIGKGEGFDDLKQRIGADRAEQWVMHLWRRACRQWPALGAGEFPARARRECFELHALTLADGREALAVVLRPTSFVAELATEHHERHAA